MKATDEITNSEDIIDSRHVIARIETLTNELTEAHTEAGTSMTFEEFCEDQRDGENGTFQDVAEELYLLQKLADEADCSRDWEYGDALIRDSYFEEYAQQLAEDIGAIQPDATWPNNCIDWAEATRLLKQDYMQVSFGDVDYWIRG